MAIRLRLELRRHTGTAPLPLMGVTAVRARSSHGGAARKPVPQRTSRGSCVVVARDPY